MAAQLPAPSLLSFIIQWNLNQKGTCLQPSEKYLNKSIMLKKKVTPKISLTIYIFFFGLKKKICQWNFQASQDEGNFGTRCEILLLQHFTAVMSFCDIKWDCDAQKLHLLLFFLPCVLLFDNEFNSFSFLPVVMFLIQFHNLP